MSTQVPSTSRLDVYQAVTDKIVQAIEAGAGEFVMPWHSHGKPITRPTNAATSAGYRGVNVVALWAEAMLCGYGSGTWASYKQWQSLGAQVRRGERGTVIVFYKSLDQRDGEDGNDPPDGRRLVARAYRVFNAAQVDGWSPATPEPASPAEAIPFVEEFVSSVGAKIRHGGEVARYLIREDQVEIPDRSRFHGSPTITPTESYYSTLLHELVHWTGAADRMDRTFGERFGDDAYSVEELVAELGAAFLCADLEITNEPRPDHAAYLAHWLAVLKRDPRALFTAASQASLAAEYLWKTQLLAGDQREE
ncbi:antirestriction protein ArdC [Caulobacter ginsengisoli]|uniref:Antirestriction protein ArdC n=1 Tax=Caulobacter ginsengisoli TaxID=400775 RepID=A0ABU0IW42_9CAUL|nr:zincin-like metallopeptidase domain-containing protein [Caulobacter ginsengisoli]MDQ0466239.1 antirestriction protein ArdC [Caulobacter ginsengisoli]